MSTTVLASTVVLVQDGDPVIVVDPGMLASRNVILDPRPGSVSTPAR